MYASAAIDRAASYHHSASGGIAHIYRAAISRWQGPFLGLHHCENDHCQTCTTCMKLCENNANVTVQNGTCLGVTPKGETIAKCGADSYPTGKTCTEKKCTCPDGVGATGKLCPVNGQNKCVACNDGFSLQHLPTGRTCVPKPRPTCDHGYQYVHDGHCADGWINANGDGEDTKGTTFDRCANRCRSYPGCGYFAFKFAGGICALYTEAGGCPDDGRFREYGAFKIS